ncbi:TPA: alanine dehydrogenase [Vibrio cholerae]|jgi:alanine dehydrogenase|uniref:Alanine dehydrogenase n=6 Tax=Vibrio cholerae TaxID=666 RepID=Q9KQU3_VIBCH|nr:alanine dehydrogenase [Vibrio cholerae]AEA78856.1 Alanine dehydrogenase [Vibrio cholerae LMA3984-4]EEY49322.1 alanine dehydrogenase [Vibrio cholerae INDRE 91/1]EYC49409.1 alanine dehydrogenase [Vibrio cholerae O1 biovar El Tor str. L-3226]MDG6205608.1 alanine dehydrogenase [Vibrio sp. NO3-D2]AAF95053.1 alanine dehydrogenase [Vibrio cholerae O1 biovar El Tor str. N16961]
MIIGVPKEIKNHEYRVGMIPASVRELVSHGHQVYVETNAGSGIGFSDDDYIAVGASILPTAADVFAKAEMIVKVKEPQAIERAMLKEGQILFTYLHLAPDFPQTEELIKSKAVCIAYETVTDNMGRLPLLAPMSEVAGRMSIQAGAQTLEKSRGGSGLLLGGVPGVAPAKVVVLGGGVVGANAARMAIGLRADVTILDRNIDTLRKLDEEFQGRANVVYSTADAIEKYVLEADLVIGAVLIPGAAAPKLVTQQHIKRMKPGSAVVDVAIDQGGCFETSHPTTHAEPTYIVDDVVHYCVANMPGAVARTSTFALNNATLPYIVKLANKGYQKALLEDAGFLKGLNVIHGKVTYKEVAENFGLDYVDPAKAIAMFN